MAGPLISLFIYSAKGFSAVLGGKQAMIIIISRHNLLSACSSCKTGLQSHPSGEQMASPGSLRLRALLAGVHGRSLSVRTGVSRPKLAGLAGGWGRKQRGTRGSQQLPSHAGLPEFYYCALICSTGPRRASWSFAHLHMCVGAHARSWWAGARCELLLPHRALGWDVSTGPPLWPGSWRKPRRKKTRTPSISSNS